MKALSNLNPGQLLKKVAYVGLAVTLLASCGKDNKVEESGINNSIGTNSFGTPTGSGFAQLEARPCTLGGGTRVRHQFQTTNINNNYAQVSSDGVFLGLTSSNDVVMVEKRGGNYAVTLSICPAPGYYDSSTQFSNFALRVHALYAPSTGSTSYYGGYGTSGSCAGQGMAEVDIQFTAGYTTFVRPFSGTICN